MTAPLWSEFRRFWSLSDMVENFRINALRLVQSGLGTLITLSNRNQQVVEGTGGYENPALMEDPVHLEALSQAESDVRSLISLAKTSFAAMHCVHINHAISTLEWWLNYDVKKWSDLKFRCISLRDAIDNELNEHIYYQYPKQRAEKLRAFSADWRVAVTAFPSMEDDAFAATDCFAMGHNTASVFHCMRVLERGISSLAAELGLNFDLQNWQNIIDQIESKIAEQRKTLPRGTEKNEKLQFLSEAAKEFFYFKDGWRNYVSHNRGKYDEHQAMGILEHTRSFMCRLASQLSEEESI